MKKVLAKESIFSHKKVNDIKDQGIYLINNIYYFYSENQFAVLKDMEELLTCIDLIKANPKMKKVLK